MTQFSSLAILAIAIATLLFGCAGDASFSSNAAQGDDTETELEVERNGSMNSGDEDSLEPIEDDLTADADRNSGRNGEEDEDNTIEVNVDLSGDEGDERDPQIDTDVDVNIETTNIERLEVVATGNVEACRDFDIKVIAIWSDESEEDVTAASDIVFEDTDLIQAAADGLGWTGTNVGSTQVTVTYEQTSATATLNVANRTDLNPVASTQSKTVRPSSPTLIGKAETTFTISQIWSTEAFTNPRWAVKSSDFLNVNFTDFSEPVYDPNTCTWSQTTVLTFDYKFLPETTYYTGQIMNFDLVNRATETLINTSNYNYRITVVDQSQADPDMVMYEVDGTNGHPDAIIP